LYEFAEVKEQAAAFFVTVEEYRRCSQSVFSKRLQMSTKVQDITSQKKAIFVFIIILFFLHLTLNLDFLRAFETSTTSFAMSFCPSVGLSAWNKSAPNGRILMKLDTELFRKSIEKIQVGVKFEKNNRNFT
jgi:hypothetical protein